MAEIGKKSRDMHVEIGATIAKTDIDIVIGVCPETKDILAQLNNKKFETHYFENSEGLADYLLGNILHKGDTMLIKGSHYGSKLFKTAEDIIGTCGSA
jgi:UDP-N-acetylmuramyl pentapeptide synthase